MISIFAVELIWLRVFLKINFQRLLQKIVFLNRDEVYFWKRLCRKNKENYSSFINKNHSFYNSIRDVATIILAPRTIEFSFRKNQNFEFYYHNKLTRNEDKYKTIQYNNLINFIKNSSLKVIYCSFGTLSGVRIATVLKWYQKMFNILVDLSDIILVISKGKIDYELPAHPQVYCFDFIPQIDFLQYVNLMISHGGLGTIKECIDASVPMLIFPLNKKVDQIGNGVRVQTNGYGILGDFNKDTEQSLYCKITQLLNLKNVRI